MKRTLSLAIAATLTCSVCYAADQTASSDAGSEATRFKGDVKKIEQQFEEKKKKAPEIELPKEEEKAPPEEKVSFTLTELTITGGTVFKNEDLKSLYESYIGKPVTL